MFIYIFTGYATSLSNFDSGNFGKSSLAINLSHEDYQNKIWELFPVLQRRDFSVYRRTKQGNLEKFKKNSPLEIRTHNYKSVVFIKPDIPLSTSTSTPSSTIPRSISTSTSTTISSTSTNVVSATPVSYHLNKHQIFLCVMGFKMERWVSFQHNLAEAMTFWKFNVTSFLHFKIAVMGNKTFVTFQFSTGMKQTY